MWSRLGCDPSMDYGSAGSRRVIFWVLYDSLCGANASFECHRSSNCNSAQKLLYLHKKALFLGVVVPSREAVRADNQ